VGKVDWRNRKITRSTSHLWKMSRQEEGVHYAQREADEKTLPSH
jgi:hypothetical protein